MNSILGAPAVLVVILAACLVIVSLLSYRRLRRIDVRRTVLVHAPVDRSWAFVSHLPTLHARHSKARDFGEITDALLRHGDGERAGSVWRARGSWREAPYWVDLELVRIAAPREIALRLRRDSAGTERGLKRHLGVLTLTESGSGDTKITWRLEARLRPSLLLWERLAAGARLRARLLDHGLRSLKIEIESAVELAPVAEPETAALSDDLQSPPRAGGDRRPESVL